MMDGHNLTPVISKILNTIISNLSALLLIGICIATVAAVIEECFLIFNNGHVGLHDILLLFIYLEIFAMVHQYVNFGKLPVRYPIYIAIIAIARYIILGMKEFNNGEIIWLSLAILLLTAATILMRVGHNYWPYNKMPEQEH